MFDRIKKAFSRGEPAAASPVSQIPSQVSEWAGTQGFAFTGKGEGFSLDGKVGTKPWRMERGRPSRKFIKGEELRARAELALNEDAAVLIMNRPLKEALEKQAYSIYTDTLQTTADPNLPEEMRWLAMYQEYGWDSIRADFWKRYSVLADDREHAVAWVDANLADLLMEWPDPAPGPEIPFMLMALRGKLYLRMEYTPAELSTVQHASAIFTSACESALGGLSTDIAI